MTKDTTPENLRKFLESDDPALVMMGLSMAKNFNVNEMPESLLYSIYKLKINSGVKEIREAVIKTLRTIDKKSNKSEDYNYKLLNFETAEDVIYSLIMVCELNGINIVKNHSIKTITTKWTETKYELSKKTIVKLPKKLQNKVTYNLNNLIEKIVETDFSLTWNKELDTIRQFIEEKQLTKTGTGDYSIWQNLAFVDFIVSILLQLDDKYINSKVNEYMLENLPNELKEAHKKMCNYTKLDIICNLVDVNLNQNYSSMVYELGLNDNALENYSTTNFKEIFQIGFFSALIRQLSTTDIKKYKEMSYNIFKKRRKIALNLAFKANKISDFVEQKCIFCNVNYTLDKYSKTDKKMNVKWDYIESRYNAYSENELFSVNHLVNCQYCNSSFWEPGKIVKEFIEGEIERQIECGDSFFIKMIEKDYLNRNFEEGDRTFYMNLLKRYGNDYHKYTIKQLDKIIKATYMSVRGKDRIDKLNLLVNLEHGRKKS